MVTIVCSRLTVGLSICNSFCMLVAWFCMSLTPLSASLNAEPKLALPAPAVPDVDPSGPEPPAIGVPSGRSPARATAAAKSKGLSRTSISQHSWSTDRPGPGGGRRRRWR